MPEKVKMPGTGHMQDERRKHPRVAIRVLGTTKDTTTGARGYGRITNLSMGGAYILTTDTLDPKDEIIIEFGVPGSDFTVETKALVCRVEEGVGMGLAFGSLSDQQKDEIGKFIRREFYGGDMSIDA